MTKDKQLTQSQTLIKWKPSLLTSMFFSSLSACSRVCVDGQGCSAQDQLRSKHNHRRRASGEAPEGCNKIGLVAHVIREREVQPVWTKL